MKNIYTSTVSISLSISVCLACISNASALNTDSITFLEKPLAYQTKHGVIEFNSQLGLGYRSEQNGQSKYTSYQASSELNYKTQIANDWDLSLQYLSNYQNERSQSYQDLFRIGVSDQWGSVLLGNISSVIFERTNRQIATGLLGANNDQFTLSLENTGGFYQWQTPSTQWMLALDKDANLEAGVSYYKPVNGIEYVIAGRINSVSKDIPDAQGVSDSSAYAIMAQAQRGKWIIDAQYLQEDISLLSSPQSIDLTTLSAGVHYKANRWGWSLSGISRDNEVNDTEQSLSLGFRYDVARGVSLNAGKSVNNSKLFPERFHSYAFSLRYEL